MYSGRLFSCNWNKAGVCSFTLWFLWADPSLASGSLEEGGSLSSFYRSSVGVWQSGSCTTYQRATLENSTTKCLVPSLTFASLVCIYGPSHKPWRGGGNWVVAGSWGNPNIYTEPLAGLGNLIVWPNFSDPSYKDWSICLTPSISRGCLSPSPPKGCKRFFRLLWNSTWASTYLIVSR